MNTNWLKENWFKIGAFAILLPVGLSLAYYFSIYLPTRHNSEYSFQQAQKCKSLSDDFLKEHVVKPEDTFSVLVESKSHFNTRLNTCLLSYHQALDLTTQRLENSYVLDVLTGDVLIETHLRDDEEFLGRTGLTKEGPLTLSDFVTREEKLMSE